MSLLLVTFVTGLVWGAGASNGQGPNGVPPAAQPAASRGTNVAVIDIGFVFKNAARFKQAMEEIKADDEAFAAEATKRRDALTAAIDNLQRMQKGGPEYQHLEEQVANDQTKLRLDMARNQKERVEREAKVYFNAYKEIEEHVNQFANRYGIDLVLRFNSEEMDPTKPESVLNGINRFVVFQKQLNITGAILDEMNRGTPPPRVSGNPAPPQIPQRPNAKRQ